MSSNSFAMKAMVVSSSPVTPSARASKPFKRAPMPMTRLAAPSRAGVVSTMVAVVEVATWGFKNLAWWEEEEEEEEGAPPEELDADATATAAEKVDAEEKEEEEEEEVNSLSKHPASTLTSP